MDQYFTANAVLSMFSKNYMDLKKGLPIRPSEMAVLNIITQTPDPHTPVLLAELLCVSKPMITAHLAALSKKGYIMKQQSLEDKHLEQLIKDMGQDEFDHLIRLAAKANKILETNQREHK